MNFCLLTGFYPEPIKKEIVDNTKSVFQDAANVLQANIIEGLSFFYKQFDIINVPFLGYYPHRYSKMSSPICEYTINLNSSSIHIDSIKFSTVPLLFYKTRKQNTYDSLLKWIKNKENDHNVIIIYSVHMPFMDACVRLKKKYPTVKLILIVPDLPQFMNTSKSLFSRIHQSMGILDRPKYKFLYGKMDGFVLLTEAMNKVVNRKNVPYAIVEGISNCKELESLEVEKYIFYSGTMAEKYGVMNLVKAFMKIQHTEYKLLLCGGGDSVNQIKEKAKANPHIVYLGQIPNNEVRKLQRKATLLVNPRQNIGEYTKYSFPSKIMEYMSSGRPTLVYKLDGMPKEYYDYLFTLESNNIQDLTMKIDEILDIEDSELSLIGLKALNFLSQNKKPANQCKKIDLLVKALY